MRVLIITPTSTDHMEVGGGVAITYFQLEKQLQNQGHDVKVLSSWNGTMDTFAPYMYDKFRLCSASRKNYLYLRQEIKNADRVIISDEFLIAIVILECIAQGVPVFYGVHTDVYELFKSYLKYRINLFISHVIFSSLYKFVGVSGNHMFTTSVSFNRKLNTTYGVSTIVIDQSFKEKVFLENDTANSVEAIRDKYIGHVITCNYLIMYAGRFSKEKRIPLLVGAKPDSAVLLIIGDGPDRDSIIAFDNDKDIRVISKMLKPEELRVFYKACDLFVSASNFETYGMTCHESLVCGTPVVVQNAQGYQSQVIEGYNGYLVEFEDDATTRDRIQDALDNVDNFDPRVTCKTGVNIVKMVTSDNVTGSFWIYHIFGRILTTFVNPMVMFLLFFMECCIASRKKIKRESKTNKLADLCFDKLV